MRPPENSGGGDSGGGDSGGGYAGPEVAYRRALALQPGHPGALTNLGTLLRAQKRHAEAIPLLRSVVALSTARAAAAAAAEAGAAGAAAAEAAAIEAVAASGAAAAAAAAAAALPAAPQQAPQQALPRPPLNDAVWSRPYMALASSLRALQPSQLAEAAAVYRTALSDWTAHAGAPPPPRAAAGMGAGGATAGVAGAGGAAAAVGWARHEAIEYKLAATLHEMANAKAAAAVATAATAAAAAAAAASGLGGGAGVAATAAAADAAAAAAAAAAAHAPDAPPGPPSRFDRINRDDTITAAAPTDDPAAAAAEAPTTRAAAATAAAPPPPPPPPPPPRAVLVTVATKHTLTLDALRASARAAGVTLVTLGLGAAGPFHFRVKVELPARWLAAALAVGGAAAGDARAGSPDVAVAQLSAWDVVVFVDAYDVLAMPVEPPALEPWQPSGGGTQDGYGQGGQGGCAGGATDASWSASLSESDVLAGTIQLPPAAGGNAAATAKKKKKEAEEEEEEEEERGGGGCAAAQLLGARVVQLTQRIVAQAAARRDRWATAAAATAAANRRSDDFDDFALIDRPPMVVFGAERGCYPDRWLWPYFEAHLRRTFAVHVPPDPSVRASPAALAGGGHRSASGGGSRQHRRASGGGKVIDGDGGGDDDDGGDDGRMAAVAGVRYPFLNSGTYGGRAVGVLAMLRASLRSSFQPISDDQRVFTRFLLHGGGGSGGGGGLYPSHGALDHGAELLQSL
jgi:hypothetical protein